MTEYKSFVKNTQAYTFDEFAHKVVDNYKLNITMIRALESGIKDHTEEVLNKSFSDVQVWSREGDVTAEALFRNISNKMIAGLYPHLNTLAFESGMSGGAKSQHRALVARIVFQIYREVLVDHAKRGNASVLEADVERLAEEFSHKMVSRINQAIINPSHLSEFTDEIGTSVYAWPREEEML